MKSDHQKAIALTVSLLAAGFFAAKILPHLSEARGQFQPWAVVWIAAWVMAVQGLHAWKLRVLLPSPPPWRKLLGVCLIGNFFGAVLFTQLAGDVCKLWMLKQSPANGQGNAWAILRDRLSSCAAVGLALTWAISAQWGWSVSWMILGGLILLAAAGSSWSETRLLSVLRWTQRRTGFPKGDLPQDDRHLTVPRWTLVHGLSLGIQAAGAVAVFGAMQWAGTQTVGLLDSVFLATVSALAVLVPLTAGGFGVREVSSYALLLHWGTSEAAATAGIAHLTLGFLGGAGLGAILGWLLLRSGEAEAAPALAS